MLGRFKQHEGEHGYQQQRHGKRAQHDKDDVQRHWGVEFSCKAGEAKQRNEYDRDDKQGEDDRLCHIRRCRSDHFRTRHFGVVVHQTEAVLYNNDGTVDDHPDGNGKT